MIFALIPVKNFSKAKERLSPLLSPKQRREFAKAMFRDVVECVLKAPELEGAAFVTKDREAEEIIKREACLCRQARGMPPSGRASPRRGGRREARVKIIKEQENSGETEAVARGIRELQKAGVRSVLVIPGDVPLVTAEEISVILNTRLKKPFCVLCPSLSRMGTNGVFLSPPDALPLRFGAVSFGPHLQESEKRKLHTRVLSLPGLELDIDEPEDFLQLTSVPSKTHACQWASENGFAQTEKHVLAPVR